jgi:hypothetical protein
MSDETYISRTHGSFDGASHWAVWPAEQEQTAQRGRRKETKALDLASKSKDNLWARNLTSLLKSRRIYGLDERV